MRVVKILAVLMAILAFSGCASTTQGGLVGANKPQFMMVSAESLDSASKLNYSKVVNDAKNKGKLNTDVAMTRHVQEISKKIIAQVGVFREDALKWNWQVNVITDDTINAWCMPGGRIVVYSGIIKKLQLTDGELAAVIGHEIAHALREHSREQASSGALQSIGVAAVSAVTGVNANLLNQAAQVGISLPFSRAHETEADRIGTELMARAGYDPHEAVNVWVKMSKLSQGSTPAILSTHPSHESRIAELKEVAKLVYPLYQASGR